MEGIGTRRWKGKVWLCMWFSCPATPLENTRLNDYEEEHELNSPTSSRCKHSSVRSIPTICHTLGVYAQTWDVRGRQWGWGDEARRLWMDVSVISVSIMASATPVPISARLDVAFIVPFTSLGRWVCAHSPSDHGTDWLRICSAE